MRSGSAVRLRTALPSLSPWASRQISVTVQPRHRVAVAGQVGVARLDRIRNVAGSSRDGLAAGLELHRDGDGEAGRRPATTRSWPSLTPSVWRATASGRSAVLGFSASSPLWTMSPSVNRIVCRAIRHFGVRRSKKLEVHPEMLELLTLGVLHDRLRLRIRLEGDALLVPADRLRLLSQRSDYPSKRPHLGTELTCRLVVLLESHLLLRTWSLVGQRCRRRKRRHRLSACQPAVIEPKSPWACPPGPARKYSDVVGPAAEPFPNAIAQRPSIAISEPSPRLSCPL